MRPRESPGDALPDSDLDVWDSILLPQAAHAGKDNWKGWCEIESEPAYFNMMLKQFGVKGAKVYELFSFDEEMLQSLPKPVHGLIFLSRWQDTSSMHTHAKTEEASKIWFANQTVDNACATYALFNIINNASSLTLGEPLSHFKEFTKSFTPQLRGEAVANFEFVRQIHNSFARRIDMLNTDLCMSIEAEPAKRGRGRNRKSRRNVEETAYHFNAFVPINNELYRLDGLEQHPQSLGPVSESEWLMKVKSDLDQQITRYEANEMESAVLVVAQDPLAELVTQLSWNIKRLQNLDMILDLQFPTWREVYEQDRVEKMNEHLLLGPNEGCGVCEEDLATLQLSQAEIKTTGHTTDDLLLSRTGLADAQARIRMCISQEKESNLHDEAKCHGREFDYSPVVFDWLRFHVKNGTVKDVLDTI